MCIGIRTRVTYIYIYIIDLFPCKLKCNKARALHQYLADIQFQQLPFGHKVQVEAVLIIYLVVGISGLPNCPVSIDTKGSKVQYLKQQHLVLLCTANWIDQYLVPFKLYFYNQYASSNSILSYIFHFHRSIWQLEADVEPKSSVISGLLDSLANIFICSAI